MIGALTWGGLILLLLVGSLAVASLVVDARTSEERARIKRLEADIARREAKYLQVLRDKAALERDLEAARADRDSLRAMLGDTTRRLFRRAGGAS